MPVHLDAYTEICLKFSMWHSMYISKISLSNFTKCCFKWPCDNKTQGVSTQVVLPLNPKNLPFGPKVAGGGGGGRGWGWGLGWGLGWEGWGLGWEGWGGGVVGVGGSTVIKCMRTESEYDSKLKLLLLLQNKFLIIKLIKLHSKFNTTDILT